MLTTGALYDDPDPDPDWYTRHDPERAKRRAISQRRDLGYDITLNPAGAA